MKNPKTLFIIVLLVIIGVVVYVWPPADKPISIEDYVSQNISTLSPEKEVLGGTFFVTDISATDGRGVVEYEDGHIAFTADFTYKPSDQTGYEITSFIIRQ